INLPEITTFLPCSKSSLMPLAVASTGYSSAGYGSMPISRNLANFSLRTISCSDNCIVQSKSNWQNYTFAHNSLPPPGLMYGMGPRTPPIIAQWGECWGTILGIYVTKYLFYLPIYCEQKHWTWV